MTEQATLWYKDAIIYQLHVRTFCDSNGDGVGDFRGLTSKLDYLRDLGISAIWLLPFYPSPLRDGGYDIAEYCGINPQYGTLEDFQRLLDEAHRRDLRVITELVLNHTSDQHPWFQKSRRDQPGGPWRDFYVWEDDPNRYSGARIIFQDFETSNWSWDPVAHAYYWHRFYSHQPDLNYDNPEVIAAVRDVLDFWLEMGVDGFRLDAVPYLYERDGTTCENLGETHDFLKRLRQYIDRTHGVRPLMAEANQWPEDAAAYYGDGDECQMNFHFPLMPRLYMALEREDRFPVVDILNQTPEIPDNCQWALFLRNHDELTLEMVTDEERDYMYRVFADDPRARLNLGIRRRLMPLLGNSRRKIELMNGLLMSLPGTPIVYYGDEIGMGDNIYLGDRDGVRTPMQWSADRNAGFSRANPQQLVLPPVVDPEFHHATVNVEAQENNRQSLLWWMRRLIGLRNRHAVFGRGSIGFLLPDNGHVLAFVRALEGETVLVVANLSRFAQFVELDLSAYQGNTPVEMTGRTRFPPIGELPYLLTLGAHSFYWFQLESAATVPGVVSAEALPAFRFGERWHEVFHGRSRSKIEATLADFLKRQDWFAGHGGQLRGVTLLDVIAPDAEREGYAELAFVLAALDFADRDNDAVLLPLNLAAGDLAQDVVQHHADRVVFRVAGSDGSGGIVYDAAHENAFHVMCGRAMRESACWPGEHGTVVASHTPHFDASLPADEPFPVPRLLEGERAPGRVNLGDRFDNRFFRQVGNGVNPALEISRALDQASVSAPIPGLAGAIEYERPRGGALTFAMLSEHVQHEGTAWDFVSDECRRLVEEMVAHPNRGENGRSMRYRSPLEAATDGRTPVPADPLGPYWHMAELIGRRTAEFHLALASLRDEAAFAPEPLTDFSRRGLVQSMRSHALRAFGDLKRRLGRLDGDVRAVAEEVLGRQGELLEGYESILRERTDVTRIRCHGDFGLRQLWYTGKDFVITGLSGDLERPVSERRIKHSPLLDLGGMLQSLFVVSRVAAFMDVSGFEGRPEKAERLREWAEAWFAESSVAFLRGYLETPRRETLLDARQPGQSRLLDAYLADRFVRSLRAGLRRAPETLPVSLEGLLYVMRCRETTRGNGAE